MRYVGQCIPLHCPWQAVHSDQHALLKQGRDVVFVALLLGMYYSATTNTDDCGFVAAGRQIQIMNLGLRQASGA